MVTLLILAGIVSYSTSISYSSSEEKFLPALTSQIDNLSHIYIASGKDEVHLDNTNSFWQIRERGNAPAHLIYIRTLLRLLAESTLVNAKTKDPRRYDKLGLDEAHSTRVRLYTTDNEEPIFDIYLGTPLPNQNSTYARIQGNPESWLISGIINPPANPDQWIETQFLSIAPTRIKSLTLSGLQKTPIHIERTSIGQSNFILSDIPTGYKVRSQIDVNQLSEMLKDIEVTSTLPLTKVSFDKSKSSVITVETFDGMEITIKVTSMKEGKFASYQFQYVPSSQSKEDEVKASYRKQQANAYNAFSKGKAYRVPDELFTSSTQSLQQFIAKE